jgi:hydroxyethylthiazole kinase-like uncharacterized protein yjeF
MHPSHSPSHPLLRSPAIRAIERDALARTAPGTLMARAALAVADAAEGLLRQRPAGTPVHAFCGPGNNGGDALLAAILLHQRGFAARAFELADIGTGPAGHPADAARVREQAHALGLAPEPVASETALRLLVGGTSPDQPPLLLDGLFGIGLGRPLAGLAETFCWLLAELRPLVVAIDVPSGIDADTGAVVGGAGARAVQATLTITMIADKPGLRTGAALDHVGRVEVAGLGIEVPPDPSGAGCLIDRQAAALLLPARSRDSSKGRFGSVLVAGGGSGMAGAALLAARAAQYAGAGKVAIVSPDAPVFDPGQPQLMSHRPGQAIDPRATLVAGCGLGTGERAQALFERLLAGRQALVLDADALNLLAGNGDPVPPAGRPLPVLTPHPLEAARLAGSDVGAIQADRVAAACTIAAARHAIVVLKGAGSVIAAPNGGWAIIDSGGPALASAGSGDVLAGLIGGLLAQGLPAWDAAALGCWTHGAAGDLWSRSRAHAAGLSAAELPRLARRVLASLARRQTLSLPR